MSEVVGHLSTDKQNDAPLKVNLESLSTGIKSSKDEQEDTHNTSIKHRKKFQLGRKKLREKIKITDIY